MSHRVTPELTPAQIRRAVMAEASAAARRAALATVAEIQRLVPVKTSQARRSITASRPETRGNTITVRIGSNVAHVRYLNDGTGLYGPRGVKITPKARRALAFVASGAKGKGKPFTLAGRARASASPASVMSGLVVVRSVRGIKPLDFIERGYMASRDARQRELRAAGPRIRERLAVKP